MMNSELVFHIGMPKTGSTALQKFLWQNANILKHYRWSYPNLKRELPDIREYRLEKERNGDLFYNYAQGPDASEKVYIENWNRLWEQVLKHLETENVIISSEGLYEYTEGFWFAAKEKYNRIKVVVYLRRQDRFIESCWNEKVKDISCVDKTFDEYVKDENERLWELHYMKKLNQISSVIGEENLVVRVYEKSQFGGMKHTLESDFLAAVGVDPDWEEFIPCSIENLRLEGNYIEIKRLCNAAIANIGTAETRRSMYALFGKLSETYSGKRQEEGYFTPTGRRDFMEQYLDENVEIARRYLHKDSGTLFDDDRVDYPIYGAYQCNSFEQDLIRAFSSMICDHENKMQILKKQNAVLVKKLLTNNIGKRNLALFGAGHHCEILMRDINIRPDMIVDNDMNKSGKEIEGIMVHYTETVKDWSKYFVIVTCDVTDAIEQQLRDIGMMKEKDYILAKEYFVFG